MAMEIVRVGASVDRLGEGLLWDAAQSALYWCDAMAGLLRRLGPGETDPRTVEIGKAIGAIALRRSGGAVAALEDGFYFLDLTTGVSEPIARFDHGRDDIRFNDGKVDRQGRFLAGTMHIRPPADGVYVGTLHRLDPGGGVERIESGIGNCNGPCFSPDGRTFYFADSPRRQIYAYAYDIARGAISDRRIFADTSALDSPPDGATVDAEGFLWSAMVTGGKIVRYDPAGKIERIIELPVRHPTNVAFGGRRHPLRHNNFKKPQHHRNRAGRRGPLCDLWSGRQRIGGAEISWVRSGWHCHADSALGPLLRLGS